MYQCSCILYMYIVECVNIYNHYVHVYQILGVNTIKRSIYTLVTVIGFTLPYLSVQLPQNLVTHLYSCCHTLVIATVCIVVSPLLLPPPQKKLPPPRKGLVHLVLVNMNLWTTSSGSLWLFHVVKRLKKQFETNSEICPTGWREEERGGGEEEIKNIPKINKYNSLSNVLWQITNFIFFHSLDNLSPSSTRGAESSSVVMAMSRIGISCNLGRSHLSWEKKEQEIDSSVCWWVHTWQLLVMPSFEQNKGLWNQDEDEN